MLCTMLWNKLITYQLLMKKNRPFCLKCLWHDLYNFALIIFYLDIHTENILHCSELFASSVHFIVFYKYWSILVTTVEQGGNDVNARTHHQIMGPFYGSLWFCNSSLPCMISQAISPELDVAPIFLNKISEGNRAQIML